MHSRATTNYELPQFNGSDKPTWLGDINGAFLAIDAAMKNNANAAAGAQESANSALAGLTTALERAQTADTKATQAIADAAAAQLTANGAAANATHALELIETINGALANRTIYRYKIPFAIGTEQTPGYYDIPGNYDWQSAGNDDLWIVRYLGGALHAINPNGTGRTSATEYRTNMLTTQIETASRSVSSANHNGRAAVQIEACNLFRFYFGDASASVQVDNTLLPVTDLFIIRENGIETIPND